MARHLTIAAAILLATPAAALACPVCGLAGTGDTSGTYAAMSVMLSAVPLGMLIGGAVWLARRVKKHDAEQPPNY